MLICYLYTFFGEVSGKGFGTFFNLVVLLLLSFKSSLYILDNSPFSAMSFANLFSLDSVFCRAGFSVFKMFSEVCFQKKFAFSTI